MLDFNKQFKSENIFVCLVFMNNICHLEIMKYEMSHAKKQNDTQTDVDVEVLSLSLFLSHHKTAGCSRQLRNLLHLEEP